MAWTEADRHRKFWGKLKGVATFNHTAMIGVLYQRPVFEIGAPCKGYPDGQPKMYCTMFNLRVDPEDGITRTNIVKFRGYGARNAIEFCDECRKGQLVYIQGAVCGWKRKTGAAAGLFSNIITIHEWMSLPDWEDFEFQTLERVLDALPEIIENDEIISQIEGRMDKLREWVQDRMAVIDENDLYGGEEIDGSTDTA